MVMEAKKSHSLSSASWTPRKASSAVKVPRAGELEGTDRSPGPKASELGVPRAGGDQCPSSNGQIELIQPSSTFSIQALNRLDNTTHIGESHLCYSVHQFKC